MNGFTLNRCSVTSNGNAIDENGLDLSQMTGNLALTNATVSGSFYKNVLITQTTAALGTATVSSSTISTTNAVAGSDGFALVVPPAGTGSVTQLTVSGSTFANNRSAGVFVSVEGTGSVGRVDVTGSTFTGNTLGVNLATGASGNIARFDVANNPTMTGASTQVNVSHLGPGVRTMEGYIRNNSNIQASNSAAIAVWIVAEGNGSITTSIQNNVVSDFGDSGIDVESRGGSGTVNATLNGNSVTQTGAPFPLAGLFLRAGNGTPGETSKLLVNLVSNSITVNDPLNGVADYYFDRFSSPSTVFQIQGLAPTPVTVSNPPSNTVGTYVQTKDTVPGRSYWVENGLYAATPGAVPVPSF